MSNKSEPFIEEWELYAKNPNHDLIEKCLKLAQMLEYPELDISEYVEKINSIGISLQNLLVEKKIQLTEFQFSTSIYFPNMDFKVIWMTITIQKIIF